MDNSSLRRKDTTKGPPLRILSLGKFSLQISDWAYSNHALTDGGGVRGYSMLIILQELMYRSYVEAEGRAPRRHEIPKPAEYFDLIAGTGTGGLIAIMLGRLRLDVETCMDVYVRMTKKVFETDKTIAGIPYRSTLFKASKLEEAIRACVKEHTIFEDEGNDGTTEGGTDVPVSPVSAFSDARHGPQRTASIRSNNSLGVSSPMTNRTSLHIQGPQWGNANASLAVTAVYKGTPKTGSSVLLRSYDSRREPPPEFNCTIWQAGRATAATGLAFKPIQIGQSMFIDEGAGKYNPSPQILDEAAVNEWPGREVGMLVSIGTGKRPAGTNNRQHEWWEGFIGGSVGDFAEARRRLIAKIEGCEETHQYMLREYLAARNVPQENYCRLNVEVGVGEFGMNEWSRLADISTNTRQYLSRGAVQKIVYDAAVKIAKIERSKRRVNRRDLSPAPEEEQPIAPPSHPGAVELPADDVPSPGLSSPLSQYHEAHPYPRTSHHDSQYTHVSSDEYPQPLQPLRQPSLPRVSGEIPYRTSGEDSRLSAKESITPSPRYSGEFANQQAPPLPPKTPISASSDNDMSKLHSPRRTQRPPYPDLDGPPPIVNKLRKPEYHAR
ncbi:MAG: hypothetical protein Q9227_002377 [Pyrenula ochraceoflavens]